MFFTPFLVESLVRLLRLFVSWPAASMTTILYYGEALPRNPRFQRLVRDELLDDENFLLHFLIAMFRCFWYYSSISSFLFLFTVVTISCRH